MKNSTNSIIAAKLLWALADPKAVALAKGDFVGTFVDLGLVLVEAERLTDFIFQNLAGVTEGALDIRERVIGEIIKRCKVGGKSLSEVLNEGVRGRSELIYSQVRQYFDGIQGRVVDFGCGNGLVAQLLNDGKGLDIVGYDVVNYIMTGVTIQVHQFDGVTLPIENNHFSAALVTNVFHHADRPDLLLKELTEKVSDTLVIIETVPHSVLDENMETEMRRVYFNDYLYNRLFNPGAGIPVPGMYRAPEGWITALENLGWEVVFSEDLGVDQKCIRDRHHLLVVEKKK